MAASRRQGPPRAARAARGPDQLPRQIARMLPRAAGKERQRRGERQRLHRLWTTTEKITADTRKNLAKKHGCSLDAQHASPEELLQPRAVENMNHRDCVFGEDACLTRKPRQPRQHRARGDLRQPTREPRRNTAAARPPESRRSPERQWCPADSRTPPTSRKQPAHAPITPPATTADGPEARKPDTP